MINVVDLTDKAKTRKNLEKVPQTVWLLGFVSMFMDISSEMIHSLLPIFLISVLNSSAIAVGLIEGVAEAVALISKTFSGILSDWFGKRKVLIFSGYALGTLTKPIFALATGVNLVFAARFLDRIGKGLRGAPRDALVADVTPDNFRGAAYGLRQSLDTVGAFLGPLLAIVLMIGTKDNFRTVFWIAFIPGLLSVAIIVFAVKEPPNLVSRSKQQSIKWSEDESGAKQEQHELRFEQPAPLFAEQLPQNDCTESHYCELFTE